MLDRPRGGEGICGKRDERKARGPTAGTGLRQSARQMAPRGVYSKALPGFQPQAMVDGRSLVSYVLGAVGC